MTLVPSTAASAVYHDALSTARSFRTLCFLVLLLVLLGQLALFFTARYADGVIPVEGSTAQNAQVEVPSGIEQQEGVELEQQPGGTVEAEEDTDLAVTTTTVSSEAVADWLYMILYFTLWAGLVFAILLCLDLLFTTLVMLNGRTVGVAKVAKAFLYSLILLMLLMPWQAILNHPTLKGGMFHLPGVLYIWPELNQEAKFANSDWLQWVRFVAWPVLALILLFVVYARSGRGIKEALGEDLPDVDEHADRPVS